MVYVTITRYDKDFTLIETPAQQKSTKDSLCTIFNELEKDGYTLVASGGASELVFVFHKDGVVGAPPLPLLPLPSPALPTAQCPRHLRCRR